MKAWIAHESGKRALGEVPEGITLEVYDGKGDYPSDPSTVDFWVPPFLSAQGATDRLADMTGLSVVQLLTAGVDAWTSKVADSVTLCSARGVHTASTSEWVLTAMLTSLRGFDHFVRSQQNAQWEPRVTTSLARKKVLIVGAGDIGKAIAARVSVFGAEPILVARSARDGVHSVGELPTLLPDADVVVMVLPLTNDTRGMVDAAFLARLKDGALFINAARGPVVVTDALLAELKSERITAAADVTDPEPLPQDHPLWEAPGLLLTPHVGGALDDMVPTAYEFVGGQLRRFARDEPLENVISGDY